MLSPGNLSLHQAIVSGGQINFNAGGGIFAGESALLTLTDSTVSGNTASGDENARGGGIVNSGTTTLIRSVVSGNRAADSVGGGLFNDFRRTLSLTDSTVSGNSAAVGGGIVNSGTLTLTTAPCRGTVLAFTAAAS